MKRSTKEDAAVAMGEAALAEMRADTARLRDLNDALAGRRPRPQLKVIRGGKPAS